MKKTIAFFIAILSMTLAQVIIISCHTPQIKNGQNGEQDSSKSGHEYAPDIVKFRQQASDTVESNKIWLDKFDKSVSKDSREAREFYRKEIDSLRQRNDIMRKDIEEYEDRGKGKWDTFKINFNRDMYELSRSIRNLKDTISK